MRNFSLIPVLFFFAVSFLFAEDEPFGFEADTEEVPKKIFTVNIGGKFYAGTSFYFNDFQNIKNVSLDLPFWGNIYLDAVSPLTETYLNFKLNGKTLPIDLGSKPEFFVKPLLPLWIDQAYMQLLAGPVVLGGGIKKITWGRADFMSVLDIVNPLDYTCVSELSIEKIKIAEPMFYMSAYFPKEMKIDFVFLPVFEGHRLAKDKRFNSFDFSIRHDKLKPIKTNTLQYFQGGFRYTSLLDEIHDIGFQYFYGFLPLPAIKEDGEIFDLKYDRSHQIGFDYGVQLGGAANLKTEIAANITGDVKGKNPYSYNPNIAWSLGAGYSFPYNITLGIYASQTIRLFQSGDKKDLLSSGIEKKLSPTDTRLQFSFSQKLLRGSLDLKINVMGGIEDRDVFISSEINWILASILLDLQVGIYAGNSNGKLGRRFKNNFIKFSIGYEF